MMRASILIGLLPPSVIGLTLPPSVVRLTDATSGRRVVLIGTMHYNPHSVAVVRGTLRATARARGLHAAAIELCDARWNSTAAARWQEKRQTLGIERLLSEDEFQVAWESARECGLPDIVLADQSIALTGRRLASATIRTLRDVVTPGGILRIARDLRGAGRMRELSGAALNHKLLAGAPLALARYVYQSPSALPFAAVSVISLTIAAAIDEATGAVATWQDAATTAVAAALFGRAALVSLIDERDCVLARNIRDACLDRGCSRSSCDAERDATAVVAVLGMAHLAGVRAALLRRECDDDDDDVNPTTAT